jgi:hypothetical protein
MLKMSLRACLGSLLFASSLVMMDLVCAMLKPVFVDLD